MKRSVVAIMIFAVLALIAFLLVPSLRRAKAYSGPSISGNLKNLQLAKEEWQREHTNEWPNAANIYGELLPGRPFHRILRPRYGEIYIINRTGETPCVYFPNAAMGFQAGQLMCVKSNKLVPLQSR